MREFSADNTNQPFRGLASLPAAGQYRVRQHAEDLFCTRGEVNDVRQPRLRQLGRHLPGVRVEVHMLPAGQHQLRLATEGEQDEFEGQPHPCAQPRGVEPGQEEPELGLREGPGADLVAGHKLQRRRVHGVGFDLAADAGVVEEALEQMAQGRGGLGPAEVALVKDQLLDFGIADA